MKDSHILFLLVVAIVFVLIGINSASNPDKNTPTQTMDNQLQEQEALEEFANVIAIGLFLRSLEEKAGNICASDANDKGFEFLMERLEYALSEQEDEDLKEQLQMRLSDVVATFESNHKNYSKILEALSMQDLQKALTLGGFTNRYTMLEAYLKNDDCKEGAIYLIGSGAADDESRFHPQSTPLILMGKHPDKKVLLDALMQREFTVNNPQGMGILISELENYQKQSCISSKDLQRAKRYQNFLYKNGFDDDKIAQIIQKLEEKKDITIADGLSYEKQMLYLQDSIEFGCDNLLEQLLVSYDIANEKFTKKYPHFMPKHDFLERDYLPLDFAISYKNEYAQKLLEQYEARSFIKEIELLESKQPLSSKEKLEKYREFYGE